jgi:hypothetical protein
MCYLDFYVLPGAIIMVSKDPKMSKPGTACKRKQVTLALPQKYEIILWLESGENHSVVMCLYKIGLLAIYDIAAVAKKLLVRT